MSYLKHNSGQEGVVLTKKATYNSIVDKAMATRYMGGHGTAQCNTTVISVWNIGNDEILQGGFIVFPSANPLRDVEDAMQQLCVPCYGITEGASKASIDAETTVWGIAQEPILPGRTGDALVSGMTVVKLSDAPSQNSMNFVTPTSTYRIALSETGTARLLCYDENGFASVLLNAGGAGTIEQVDTSTPFSVKKVNSNTVWVNGGYVQENGYTRFEFPGQNVEITQDCTLYLIPSPRGCGIEILNLPYGSIFKRQLYYTKLCDIFVNVVDEKIAIKEIKNRYIGGNITLSTSMNEVYAYRILNDTNDFTFQITVSAGSVAYSSTVDSKTRKVSFPDTVFTVTGKQKLIAQQWGNDIVLKLYSFEQDVFGTIKVIATFDVVTEFNFPFLVITRPNTVYKEYKGIEAFFVNFWDNNTVICNFASQSNYNAYNYPYRDMQFVATGEHASLTIDKSGFIVATRENYDKDFTGFYLSETEVQNTPLRITVAQVSVGQFGNITDLIQLVTKTLSVYWYTGSFAIAPIGNDKYLIRGGRVYPNGTFGVSDTVLTIAERATVYLIVRYSIEYKSFFGVIDTDESGFDSYDDSVTLVTIGNVSNGNVVQTWQKGDMYIIGRAL